MILKCCEMLLAGLLLTISFFYDAPDIDECESGIHNCLPDFICQNTLGSFRCRPKLQCKSGFIQDALGNCIGKTAARLPGPQAGRATGAGPPRMWGLTVDRTEVGQLFLERAVSQTCPARVAGQTASAAAVGKQPRRCQRRGRAVSQ